MADDGIMPRLKNTLIWGGMGLAIAGLVALLVAWVGLDRANEYLGVPATVATLIGLALSAYGVFGVRPPTGTEQLVEDSEIGGSNLMIGRVGSVRNRGASAGPVTAPGPEDPAISQVVRRTKIEGDNAILGETTEDVNIQGGS